MANLKITGATTTRTDKAMRRFLLVHMGAAALEEQCGQASADGADL